MTGIEYYESPLGLIEIRSESERVVAVTFVTERISEERTDATTNECQRQLDEYFYSGRKFFDVPLKPAGTPFQQAVWQVLMEIPYGKTISYQRLAILLGDVKVIRAAGVANGQNPIAILIPCHRVIGKNGSLVGYGGGLEKKEWLLQHEGSLVFQLNIFE